MKRIVLALVALFGVGVAPASAAGSPATTPQASRPDFSGVWFPDAKASGRWPTERPFTTSMAAAREQWNRTHTPIDLTRDDENLSCIPYTLPYVMTTITQYPFEIVATPRRILLLTEVFGQVRRIEMEGEERGDRLPSRMGISRGHWEGAELVVETTHLLPLHVGHRYPSSPAQRVVERFSLLEDGPSGRQMQVQVQVIDPLVYREPVTVRMIYKSAADVELGEYICGQDLWDQQLSGNASRIPWR